MSRISARPATYCDALLRPEPCVCGRLVVRSHLCPAWEGRPCPFEKGRTQPGAVWAQPDQQSGVE